MAHTHMGEATSQHEVHFLLVAVAFVGFMFYLWWDSRRQRGAGGSASERRGEISHWLTVTLLVVAGIGHLPVTAEHLREAPYMGVLFVLFTLASLGVAGVLALTASGRAYAAAAGLCVAAVLAYAATRLVAFPQLADDVGAWIEPWGVVCVASETAVVVLAARELRRTVHPGTGPSTQPT